MAQRGIWLGGLIGLAGIAIVGSKTQPPARPATPRSPVPTAAIRSAGAKAPPGARARTHAGLSAERDHKHPH